MKNEFRCALAGMGFCPYETRNGFCMDTDACGNKRVIVLDESGQRISIGDRVAFVMPLTHNISFGEIIKINPTGVTVKTSFRDVLIRNSRQFVKVPNVVN